MNAQTPKHVVSIVVPVLFSFSGVVLRIPSCLHAKHPKNRISRFLLFYFFSAAI